MLIAFNFLFFAHLACLVWLLNNEGMTGSKQKAIYVQNIHNCDATQTRTQTK